MQIVMKKFFLDINTIAKEHFIPWYLKLFHHMLIDSGKLIFFHIREDADVITKKNNRTIVQAHVHIKYLS